MLRRTRSRTAWRIAARRRSFSFKVLGTSHRGHYGPGVVMDILWRKISMHYIRIHFGYAPRTHNQSALRARENGIYLSCPKRIAKIYQILIPNMRVRIQVCTRFLNFSGWQNSSKLQSTSLFTFRQSGDSCANAL